MIWKSRFLLYSLTEEITFCKNDLHLKIQPYMKENRVILYSETTEDRRGERHPFSRQSD